MYDLRAMIIKLREEKGWKAAELAKRAMISGAAISDIESGKKTPGIETLMKIAHAFGMELSELLERSKGQKINIDANIENKSELIGWALRSENRPYLEFIYNLSKEVPVESLGKLKILKELDLKPSGQNDGGK